MERRFKIKQNNVWSDWQYDFAWLIGKDFEAIQISELMTRKEAEMVADKYGIKLDKSA